MKKLSVIPCGTTAQTVIGSIKGIITAISIRGERVVYELSHYVDGSKKEDWLERYEFRIISGDDYSERLIGFQVKSKEDWFVTAFCPINEEFEVIGFHPDWIDEDFNPKGTRVGFINGEGKFTSAHWLDYHDTYQNKEDIIPTHWLPIPNSPK